MALERTDWYFDYIEDPGLTRRLARNQLGRIGAGSDDSTAWNKGYARLWEDDPPNPYQYGNKVTGTPVLNETEQRAEQINFWTQRTAEEIRATLLQQINIQVFAPSANQLIEDPFAGRSVESTSGGASARRSDLDDTPDEDLNDFDPTITPTPADGIGYVEAKQTTFVDRLEPWVSAPDDIYGLVVVLEVMSETGDEGAHASAHLFGSDQRVDNSVLPFTRDGANPKIWRVETRDGWKWSDPNSPARSRLYWANGSIPVDNKKTIHGYGDRDYSIVRYGGS